MSVEPGQLRRFHDDAFFANERHLNGKVFMVASIEGGNIRFFTILIDGVIDAGWNPRILQEHSGVLDD